MSDMDYQGKEEIHSKVLRAGRRTYFFDVRSTKADDFYLTITESKNHRLWLTVHQRRTYFFDVRSTKADDFYLTITESKKHTNENGNSFYKKHKIYLYKEDFENFKQMLTEATDFIINERGTEVISETHEPDFHKKHENGEMEEVESETSESPKKSHTFTDISFDDI